jgi:hypothetical protein
MKYLKKCAFVRWGSPGFLNKLRFFLPEPAFMTFQRNVTLRTLQPSSSMYKSNSLMQVDQVSGVWTYTLQSSPIGSVSTQSTNDHQRLGYMSDHPGGATYLTSTGQILAAKTGSPSVISSVYSHHTYQSIPEGQNQHIYHTLEPSLGVNNLGVNNLGVNNLGVTNLGVNSLGVNNLGINSLGVNNLGVNSLGVNNLGVTKPPRLSLEREPVNAVYINRNLDLVTKSEDGVKTESPSASPSSSTSEDCHHAHSQSGISAQQLIPNKSMQDEYVV